MVKSSAESVKWPLLLFLSCSLSACFSYSDQTLHASKKTYIVHMEKSAMPEPSADHLEWFSSTIKSVITEESSFEESDAAERIMYGYENAFHGFAARLKEDEAERLEARDGVLAVFPETIYRLHTTRSPQFLGLETHDGSGGIWSTVSSDHDVVVGVLDTGIWPDSPSFRDDGMRAVPGRWKGACEAGRGFTPANCNKKIIGARIFYRGYEAAMGEIDEKAEFKSPRDQDGHGTHTAATIAGSPVRGASLQGYAQGTARGMAPGARVAVYKVCWLSGCFSSDILSAVDRAVADGVDVLSISLGGGVASYYRDSLAIAAFGAAEKGVFISCSAGNGGPDPLTLTNVSPWIATVGASTIDRDFPSYAKLGDGRVLKGVSLYRGGQNQSSLNQHALVYLKSNSTGPDPRSLCLQGALDPRLVAGKIVLCDRGISPRVQKGQVVKDAGGLGMILANTDANGEELVADCHLLPAVAVGEANGKAIKHYIRTTSRPTAALSFAETKLGIRPSPVVAAFSSRGPNFLTLDVLKPDMVAPGVNILAAWTGAAGPSSLPTDKRRVSFNILSGTSMSCPHVSGVAALLKAKHPEWSPAAIKSALMTTAYVHDNTRGPLKDAATGAPSNSFVHGAGHIDPIKALDPGLVYDLATQDYIEFLCSQKLTPMQLKVFTKTGNQSCGQGAHSAGNLNYPAISAVFPSHPATPNFVTLSRTVTNVGPPTSTYHATVAAFRGAEVSVEPNTLRFGRKGEKLSYKITISAKSIQATPVHGDLVWSDGMRNSRIPIVISWLH